MIGLSLHLHFFVFEIEIVYTWLSNERVRWIIILVYTGSKFKFQDFEECSDKPFYNGPLFCLHLYVFLYAMMLVYSIISFVLEYLFCHLFYAAKLRAPKWCECPVGASFGFGGKLVSFRPKLHAAGASEVSLLDKLLFLLYFLLFFSTYSFKVFLRFFCIT